MNQLLNYFFFLMSGWSESCQLCQVSAVLVIEKGKSDDETPS